MSRIAIIPARGGSKRIPKKNIRLFHGKPIIAYSIQAAIDSGMFSEVMVSTDDSEIEEVARSFGASAPFLRSPENSGDFATLADVVREVLHHYEKKGRSFNQFCCILPTAPLISAQKIRESFQILEKARFDSVIPTVRFSYPIHRALKLEDESLAMMWPEYVNTRSQDLPAAYHDSGQFYSVNVDAFRREQIFFTKRCTTIELSEIETQDIDSLVDWQLAELKYRMLKKENE